MAQSDPLCLFPIYRARAVYEHCFFMNKKLMGQLDDREEIFAESEVYRRLYL